MLRYNHGIIERKWRETCESDPGMGGHDVRVCTVLVPENGGCLGLENARLVVLTDFFSSVYWGKRVPILTFGAPEGLLHQALKLGLNVQNDSCQGTYDLAVIPRDYAVPLGTPKAARTLLMGRLLQGGWTNDFLPDFGADALRLYFLSLGPPTRDYTFEWTGLASAYRFLSRLWNLGANCANNTICGSSIPSYLVNLQVEVHQRLLQQKPHTALASVMGFLKGKSTLTRLEVREVALLLQPFIPFLSAELLQLVTAIKD